MLKRRREELHSEVIRVSDRMNQNQDENITGKILSEKQRCEYLLVLVNMLLFHAHILLLKTDDRKLVTSEEKLRLKDFFFLRMLKEEKEFLPADYCIGEFFKYVMYKEALHFLFYRGEYEQLLTLIQEQYGQSKVEGQTSLQNFWVENLKKYAKKINSNF